MPYSEFLYKKKCLITSKLGHLILQKATLSTYNAITKYVHINGKVCAHLSPSICTYRHVPLYSI